MFTVILCYNIACKGGFSLACVIKLRIICCEGKAKHFLKGCWQSARSMHNKNCFRRIMGGPKYHPLFRAKSWRTDCSEKFYQSFVRFHPYKLEKNSSQFWNLKIKIKFCDGVRSGKSRITLSIVNCKLHPARWIQWIIVRKLQQRQHPPSLADFQHDSKWTETGIHCDIRWLQYRFVWSDKGRKAKWDDCVLKFSLIFNQIL